MLKVDKQSRTPIYEQIINQYKQRIISGMLSPDDTIPSVRALSLSLSINPNTVQKAYNEMERSGISYSVPGVGRFVSADSKKIILTEADSTLSSFCETVSELKALGISKSQIDEKINNIYSYGGNK